MVLLLDYKMKCVAHGNFSKVTIDFVTSSAYVIVRGQARRSKFGSHQFEAFGSLLLPDSRISRGPRRARFITTPNRHQPLSWSYVHWERDRNKLCSWKVEAARGWDEGVNYQGSEWGREGGLMGLRSRTEGVSRSS